MRRRKPEELERGEERVLGSGDVVEELFAEDNPLSQERRIAGARGAFYLRAGKPVKLWPTWLD